jgi:hypothetical protein
MLNVNPEEEGGDEFWRMVGDVAGDDQQFSEDADLISSNSINTFISDPDFLMDAQLATGNMDTAICSEALIIFGIYKYTICFHEYPCLFIKFKDFIDKF